MYEQKKEIALGMIRPATARRLDGYTARQSTSLARIQHSRKKPYVILTATAVQKTAEFNAGIAKVNTAAHTTGKLRASPFRAVPASLAVSPPFSVPLAFFCFLASRGLGLIMTPASPSSAEVMRVMHHQRMRGVPLDSEEFDVLHGGCISLVGEGVKIIVHGSAQQSLLGDRVCWAGLVG